ncbi:MAG: DNA repair exonuclease [Clostridia bacterium]|nr:DNA repair exonuclease [Clostridia bacterium]
MSKIRIVHCADVHFGAKFGAVSALADTLRAEQMQTFEKMIDFTRANADILLLAGDLFNTPVPEKELADKVAALLGRAAVPVFITSGNHDPAAPDSVYNTTEFPENVHIFKDENLSCVELENIGARVFGAGFANPVCRKITGLEDFTHGEETTDVLILHADLDGAPDGPYNSVESKALAALGFDYAALGHIHKRFIGDNIAYCGCPMGTGFDESGQKGWLYVEAEKGERAKIEFIPSGSRSFIVQELSEPVDEKLQGDPKRDIYRINVTGNVNLAEISRYLKEKVFYFELSDGRYVLPDITEVLKEQSLRGEFVRKVLEAEQSGEFTSEQCSAALRFGLEAFDREVRLFEDN